MSLRSAYQYYSKINSQAIKEELLGEGKDASVGNLASALSTKVPLNPKFLIFYHWLH
jgi:hypothetical protein